MTHEVPFLVPYGTYFSEIYKKYVDMRIAENLSVIFLLALEKRRRKKKRATHAKKVIFLVVQGGGLYSPLLDI